MANYHCSLRIFSRSKSHNAVSLAAYRSGEALFNEETQKNSRVDKVKSQTLIESFIMLPEGVSQEYYHREVLWNAVEHAEGRKNSCVARELEVGLVYELTSEHRLDSVRELASWLVERYHTAVDVCIHHAPEGNDTRNFYAHVMFATRELTAQGFGKKLRVLDDLKTGRGELEAMRQIWADINNSHLEQEGHDIRIDSRSLMDQGKSQIAQRKRLKRSKKVS